MLLYVVVLELPSRTRLIQDSALYFEIIFDGDMFVASVLVENICLDYLGSFEVRKYGGCLEIDFTSDRWGGGLRAGKSR